MDPSKIYGEEECESSGSGWTMYLGSRQDGENDHQHYSDDDHHDGRVQGYYNSDDSMVSDASSRPSTHQMYRPVHNAAAKQEEKGKVKKQSASGASRKYTKAGENKRQRSKALRLSRVWG